MREIPPPLQSFQRAARVVHKADVLSELRIIGRNNLNNCLIDSIKAHQIFEYAKYLGFENEDAFLHYSMTDEGKIIYSNSKEEAYNFRLHNNIYMGGVLDTTDPKFLLSNEHYDGSPDVLEKALIYVIDRLEELPENTVSYGPLFMVDTPDIERTAPKGDLSLIPKP